jgi:hypothetical protein
MAALMLLLARETVTMRTTVSKRFPDSNGAALRDGALSQLGRRGWKLASDEKRQWSGATVYDLHLLRRGARLHAEIWSHGDRSRVVLRFGSRIAPDEYARICGAFDPPGDAGRGG